MKISFVEAAPTDLEYFEKELASHDLEACGDLDDCAPDTEAVSIFIGSAVTKRFLVEHKSLRLIVTRSITYDHIDIKSCARRGVTVCNVGASYGDNTVPEHIFALILALCRKLRPAMDVVSGRSFSYEALRGTELMGKTLGVIGTGRIGRQVLRLAAAFGMKTLGSDSHRDPEAAKALGFRYVSVPQMLKRADIVSINVPLNRSTYHLFNRETFAMCRRGLILINTARGPIIDSEALIEALDAGIIAGAGLDVLEDERVMRKRAAHILTDQILAHLQSSFAPREPLANNVDRISEVRSLMQNSRLLAHPNVIVTPHIAFNSHEAIDRINRITVANIKAFLRGKPQLVVAPRTRGAAQS